MLLVILTSAFCILHSCRTVGVSKTEGGYAEISPTVAAEMILDSSQVVVLDVRPEPDFRGPEGHIAGSLNAPLFAPGLGANAAAAIAPRPICWVRLSRPQTFTRGLMACWTPSIAYKLIRMTSE
jgi:hypothetical protein